MLTGRGRRRDPGRRSPRPHPGPARWRALRELLAHAKRPLVIVVGGPAGRAIAQAISPSVCRGEPCSRSACAFRCQDIVRQRHPCYAGDVGIGINPKLAERVRIADVLLVVGARLGEMTTSGYTLLDIPVPKQALVHVHAGGDELGRVYQPALADQCGAGPTAAAWPRWRRSTARLAGLRRRGACRLSRVAGATAAAGRSRPVARSSSAARAPAGRCDHHQRRRQLHGLGASLLPLPAFSHAARAHQRRDGLWRAGGDRGQGRASRPRRRILERRRLLP